MTPRNSPWLPILTLCLAAACGGDDLVLPGDGEMAIRVVDGDGQSGSVGELLAAPVVVEVIDSKGDPVEGVTVTFALTSAGAGAEISPASSPTDVDGHAEAHVLLGDKVGLQTGKATITGNGNPLAAVTFSALAAASSPPESPPPESPPPPSSDNKRPQADFGVTCHDLRCSFDDQSKDDDGSIASRHWDFGDGSSSNERNPSHSYASAGDVQVTLTVTDNGGATDTRTRTADPSSPSSPPDPPSPPPAQNKPPKADFEVACQDLRCTFVDRSTDEDGSVARWEWDFGDGSTSSERNPSHTYAAAGKYDVLLVATDDDGAADTRSHKAEPKSPPEEPPPPPPDPPSPPPPPPPPANEAPHADFHAHCEDESDCEFEDTSRDDDGTIVTWSWNFGDGGTSSERNPTHRFSSKGEFDVSLTVTDDDGASNTKTHKIHVKKD